jgi:hypothetical protein
MKGIFIQLNPTKIHFWGRKPKGFNKWTTYFGLARLLSVVAVAVAVAAVITIICVYFLQFLSPQSS